MSVEIDNKVKEHIYVLDDMTKEEALEYSFKNFYEYIKNDNQLADLFFIKIASLISNFRTGYFNNKVKYLDLSDKIDIIDASYKYVYENKYGLRGPLANIFGELLDEGAEAPYIEPYMELLRMLSKGKK